MNPTKAGFTWHRHITIFVQWLISYVLLSVAYISSACIRHSVGMSGTYDRCHSFRFLTHGNINRYSFWVCSSTDLSFQSCGSVCVLYDWFIYWLPVTTVVAWVGFLSALVFVFFPHDISKTDAAGITKLDSEMFHHESWKPIDFGIKHQGQEAQKHCWCWSWHCCQC